METRNSVRICVQLVKSQVFHTGATPSSMAGAPSAASLRPCREKPAQVAKPLPGRLSSRWSLWTALAAVGPLGRPGDLRKTTTYLSPAVIRAPQGILAMQTLACSRFLSSFLGAVVLGPWACAAEWAPPRVGLTQPRTGQTQRFGSGTLTNRSDGTSSQTRPFGSGSITTERTRDGRTITGQTQKFGSGTITRWSDGSTTETRPFGSGTLTTERRRDGRTVTGQTQAFGSGTITNRSDGSSSQTQRFGSGTIQRDRPGRQGR